MEKRNAAFSGGRRMYDLRKANKWEQSYIEQWTREHFGDEGVLTVPQVSKLENGAIKRIGFADAVRWGQVFDLTPNEMATIFGLWHEPVGVKPDPLLRDISNRLETLPPELKDLFLENLRHELWMISKLYKQYEQSPGSKKPSRSTEPPAMEAIK